MIYALFGFLLLFVVSFAGLLRSFEHERQAWAAERRELLNRIQRPDQIQVAPRPEFLVPERELDEWNRVGQIVIDPEYGLDETD